MCGNPFKAVKKVVSGTGKVLKGGFKATADIVKAPFSILGGMTPSAAGGSEIARLPEAPVLPRIGGGISSRRRAKQRRAAASSTILTGPQGLTGQATTGRKTLLGA